MEITHTLPFEGTLISQSFLFLAPLAEEAKI